MLLRAKTESVSKYDGVAGQADGALKMKDDNKQVQYQAA